MRPRRSLVARTPDRWSAICSCWRRPSPSFRDPDGNSSLNCRPQAAAGQRCKPRRLLLLVGCFRVSSAAQGAYLGRIERLHLWRAADRESRGLRSRLNTGGMQLMPGLLVQSTPRLTFDLTEAERFALRNLLAKTIETSHHPLSRRILTLKAILSKLVRTLSAKPSAPGPRSPRP